jgi:hypothetical protein
MYHEKKRAQNLMQEIMAFELDQNVRVERIEKDIIDAETFIDDIKEGELQAKNQMLVEVLRRGQCLPFESSKVNWEVDTNDGDEAAKPGGLSKGISQSKAHPLDFELTSKQKLQQQKRTSET